MNRTAVTFLAAETDFIVQGQALDNQNALWYQLDKDEAAPGKLVNEAWVAAAEVTTSGGCEAVSDVDAPPIIPMAPSNTTGISTSVTICVPAVLAFHCEVLPNFRSSGASAPQPRSTSAAPLRSLLRPAAN